MDQRDAFRLPPTIVEDEMRAWTEEESWADAYWRKTPAHLLWHYTTHQAFLKIIATKQLHATEILYLNDAREYSFAVELLASVVAGYPRPAGAAAATALKLIQENTRADPASKPWVFVASLSEREDDLAQWRAYSGSGPGVAIGFEPRRLQYFASRAGFHLVSCVYDRGEQESMIRQAVAAGLEYAESLTTLGRPHSEIATEVLGRFQNDFAELAARIKNPAFRDESEWRIVAGPMSPEAASVPDHISCRAGRSSVIPYRTMTFQSDIHLAWPIPHLYVGPAIAPELFLRACLVALWEASPSPECHDLLSVFPSSTHYRPWF